MTIGGLLAAGALCCFLLWPYTLRELSARAVLGRDISKLHTVGSAIQVYHLERGSYPASLDEPNFAPYIDEHVVAFLREGRVIYHPPAADSPPTFIFVHMTTPRGDCSTQLDGKELYSRSK
jgi:hypothetical protein